MTDERIPREAELARLADGSLPADRQAQLRAEIAGSPELTAALAEQERAVAMLRAVDHPAPASLRARVDELTGAGSSATAGRTRGRGSRPAGMPRWRRAFALPAATALAVVIAALVALLGGGSGAPTVPQAARLALAAATLPAPRADVSNPGSLTLRAAGIAFPDWGTSGRWAASGARTATVDGRRITTVYYADAAGRRVGYAIASGSPLPGARGETVRVYGVTFTLQRQGSARLITWVREGHTCVVAGHASYETLLRLAGTDGR
jgi:anti-sigma factor RsiW